MSDDDLTASGGVLGPAPEPIYDRLGGVARPVRDSLPLLTVQRGAIQFKRMTPEEQRAAAERYAAELRRVGRRRRLARPLHAIARPILWLAYRIGPECDRPRERSVWEDE